MANAYAFVHIIVIIIIGTIATSTGGIALPEDRAWRWMLSLQITIKNSIDRIHTTEVQPLAASRSWQRAYAVEQPYRPLLW